MMEIIKRVVAVIIIIVILNTLGLLKLALIIVGGYFLIEIIYRLYKMWKGRDYDDGKR